METFIQEALLYAKEDLDHEVCGLVIVLKGRKKLFKCRNIAENTKENFIISAEDWVKAYQEGEIVGVVHSHPTSRPYPSLADKVGCEKSGVPWTIVNPRTDETFTFEPEGFEAPLYGREYCYGVLDCYTFIQDYYKQTYNMILRDYEHAEFFWNLGQDLYRDNFSKEGFYVIDRQDLKVGDVAIMTISSDIGNHGAIYIGEGKIAHHLYGRLSSRDIYSQYYRNNTVYCLRHESMR